MDTVEDLKEAYVNGCIELGIHSDAEFMERWRLDPERYGSLLTIRMRLISILAA